jgi:hypothetical protein
VGRAVLRLLLACAPLPEAVTWDASTGARGALMLAVLLMRS